MWGNSRQTTIASSKWFTLHTHCRQIQPRREIKNEHRSTLRAHFRRTMGKYLCMCRLGACWEPLNIFGQKAAMMCVCFASSVTCTIFGKNRRSILAATREMTYSHKCTHAHRIRQCLFGNGYGSSSGSSSGNNSSTTTSTVVNVTVQYNWQCLQIQCQPQSRSIALHCSIEKIKTVILSVFCIRFVTLFVRFILRFECSLVRWFVRCVWLSQYSCLMTAKQIHIQAEIQSKLLLLLYSDVFVHFSSIVWSLFERK